MDCKYKVISLEYAKKFKELGILQRSEKCWTNRNKTENDYYIELTESNIRNLVYQAEYYVAFDLLELGIMLNEYIEYIKRDWDLGYTVYLPPDKDNHIHLSGCETKARAYLLDYLVKKEIISIKDINKRIKEYLEKFNE